MTAATTSTPTNKGNLNAIRSNRERRRHAVVGSRRTQEPTRAGSRSAAIGGCRNDACQRLRMLSDDRPCEQDDLSGDRRSEASVNSRTTGVRIRPQTLRGSGATASAKTPAVSRWNSRRTPGSRTTSRGDENEPENPTGMRRVVRSARRHRHDGDLDKGRTGGPRPVPIPLSEASEIDRL